MAQGTFYLYFPSKRDAFDALMEEWFDAFQRVVDEASSFHPATFAAATERAQADVTTVLRLCADRPLLTRLMLKQAEGVGPDVSARMEEFRLRMAAGVERTLTCRQQAGLMRSFHTGVVAQAMVGMMERVAFRWFVMGETPALSPEELAEELVRFQAWGTAQPSLSPQA